MTSHKQCLIPGPIEVSDQVLESMATKATSHVDPSFIQTFSSALKLLRKVFVTENAQPVILAGSGTLTWDVCASNLVDKNDNVLVIITGIFGTWYQECLEVYGANVDVIEASFGASVSCADILTKLASKEYKMIALTHVDTSTSVLLNLKQICIEIKNSFPNLLIVVDGVCSIGAEELRFDDWGIDFAGTASQKAIGCPPGLAIMMISQRAVVFTI